MCYECKTSASAVNRMSVFWSSLFMIAGLVTENRKDFIKLHRRRKDHWGIIVCTADDPDIVARKIVDAIKDKNDLQNQLVRINRSS